MKQIKIKIIALFMALGLFIGLMHEHNTRAESQNKQSITEKDNKRHNRTNNRYPKQKKSCRDRRRRFGWGFLGGGATGGLIAGVAGSAKWTPLGIVAGGLLGGAIGAATAKDCDEE